MKKNLNLRPIKVDLRKKQREAARTAGRQISKAPQDLIEPTLSQNAAYIAKTRYSFRDEKGEPIETPKDLFWRVAYYMAQQTEFMAVQKATQERQRSSIN